MYTISHSVSLGGPVMVLWNVWKKPTHERLFLTKSKSFDISLRSILIRVPHKAKTYYCHTRLFHFSISRMEKKIESRKRKQKGVKMISDRFNMFVQVAQMRNDTHFAPPLIYSIRGVQTRGFSQFPLRFAKNNRPRQLLLFALGFNITITLIDARVILNRSSADRLN